MKYPTLTHNVYKMMIEEQHSTWANNGWKFQEHFPWLLFRLEFGIAMLKSEFKLMGNFVGKGKNEWWKVGACRGPQKPKDTSSNHLQLTFSLLCDYVLHTHTHTVNFICVRQLKHQRNQNKGSVENGVEWVWCCVIITIPWYSWKRVR